MGFLVISRSCGLWLIHCDLLLFSFGGQRHQCWSFPWWQRGHSIELCNYGLEESGQVFEVASRFFVWNDNLMGKFCVRNYRNNTILEVWHVYVVVADYCVRGLYIYIESSRDCFEVLAWSFLSGSLCCGSKFVSTIATCVLRRKVWSFEIDLWCWTRNQMWKMSEFRV